MQESRFCHCRPWRLSIGVFSSTGWPIRGSPQKPGGDGKHYYYRPKGGHRLSLETIQQHLNGHLTIALYAINPKTQRSKWVAIDADYESALEDLLKLQWELRRDGIESALEKSAARRSICGFSPTNHCLPETAESTSTNLARRLRVPVKGGAGLAEGIEVLSTPR